MSLRSTLCRFLILWLLLPGIVAPMRLSAQGDFVPHRRKAFRSAPGVTYVLEENFEGTGIPSGWTAGNATHDYDYTTTALQGSQSYRQTGAATSPSLTSTTFTGASTMEAYTRIRFISLPTAAYRAFYLLNGTAECIRISVTATGAVEVRAGGGTAVSTTDTMTTGVTYHLWCRYVAGSGANAFGSVAWSTDGTRPTSGNKYRESTNGTATLNPDRIRYGVANGNTFDVIYDRGLASTGTIPNNP
jgi:hypothetical protein